MADLADFIERCPLATFGAFVILVMLADSVGKIGRCRCRSKGKENPDG